MKQNLSRVKSCCIAMLFDQCWEGLWRSVTQGFWWWELWITIVMLSKSKTLLSTLVWKKKIKLFRIGNTWLSQTLWSCTHVNFLTSPTICDHSLKTFSYCVILYGVNYNQNLKKILVWTDPLWQENSWWTELHQIPWLGKWHASVYLEHRQT